MAADESFGKRRSEDHQALALEWRRLTRAATFVALLTSPMLFALLYYTHRWSLPSALVGTFIGVIAFRGLIDVVAHKVIPRPSLYGADREALLDDAVARRRVWYWRGKYKLLVWLGLVFLAFLFVVDVVLGSSPSHLFSSLGTYISQNAPILVSFAFQLPLLMFINVFILFGPLLMANLRQMKGYEPGDADWGVKLEDVRGQAEPKEEVTRVISLWQSGEEFRKAGGKPERGLLFIGAPGTGKTMLSKAIATSFNSPIVIMPGSGFVATFIGIDVIVVMAMIAKARRLARKWGGQCIIFIDEIDAVGLRRQALSSGFPAAGVQSIEELSFYGPFGARNQSGDLILETRAWRERMFEMRAEAPRPWMPPVYRWADDRVKNFMFPGGMGMGGGGSGALNQLLVQMDGVDSPPMMKKFWTNRVNTFLDATYFIPRKVAGLPLRLPPPKPRSEQIYFVGATNVPIDRLDPALIRPGRMGRHIWFRTPTKEDRKDIFDLYMARVAHVADLDSERRRDELARITNGYSPAMIEQICSMALTLAHADGRMEFAWDDVVEAITTTESGTAQGIEYVPGEALSTAIHEAGHAVASHVYCEDHLSTRLSIRKRGHSYGHHQAMKKEDKFLNWRHEEVAELVWVLGAMAAEHVFYGENGVGVGGDVQSATAQVARMVGMCGMGPEPIDLAGRDWASPEERDEAAARYMERFERIGAQIMNRAGGSALMGDPIPAILGDPGKRRAAAQILGQAYITAYCLILHNRDQVRHIAETLLQRKELHGDEVVAVLDAAQLEAPSIDITDETTWPTL
ncbi:MAG: cell division protease FtsH [Solirubrobacteraceae bacterium]|nr:cell division protease FtsH [Solirubrobacteraceae bacterium]